MAQSRYVARLLPEARPTASAVTSSITAASTPRPHVEMPGAADMLDEAGPVVPEDVPLPVDEVGATTLASTVAGRLTG